MTDNIWHGCVGRHSTRLREKTYSGGPVGDLRVTAMRVARSDVRRNIGRIPMYLLHHLPHQHRPVEVAGTSNIKSRLHLRAMDGRGQWWIQKSDKTRIHPTNEINIDIDAQSNASITQIRICAEQKLEQRTKSELLVYRPHVDVG